MEDVKLLETNIVNQMDTITVCSKSNSAYPCEEVEDSGIGSVNDPSVSALINETRKDDSAFTQCEINSSKNDDYYETISADSSICGDDHVSDIDAENSHQILVHDNMYNQIEQCSFLDLPFVPKLQFSREISSLIPSLNNSDINKHRRISGSPLARIIKPNFDFSIPPPNYNNNKVVDQNSISSGSQPDLQCLPSNNIPSNLASSVSSLLVVSNDTDNKDSLICDKIPIADWLDENGDPVKGAFDNIETNINSVENTVLKNSKIEYVFSVRETKNVSVSNSSNLNSHISSDLNISALTNTNVLLDTVAGNLGLSTENVKLYEEEKKLFLESKSGDEYKVALQANLKASHDPSISKTVAAAENAKRELLNRFRRNPFTDKKNDSTSDILQKEEPKKTQEESALESQAVTEILKEIQRGAARAKEQGALGWQKCPVPVTNKTFLRNTLVSTLREPYRPPIKRGRFHVGLQGDKIQSRCCDDGDNNGSDSDSQSSRSTRSRFTSRSSSPSYNTHTSDDEYNERSSHHRRGRGSWPHGPNQFYDEWAAYYGYQWYGPEAYSMYYGPEGWPADPYMYYEDPQAWQGYNSYYGTQNLNYHAQGRGMRSRGRGRGWTNYTEDLRDYIRTPRSRSQSYSRSVSQSRSELSHNRHERSHSKRLRLEVSRSKSRSVSKTQIISTNKSILKSVKHIHSRSPSGSPQNANKTKKKTSKKKKKKHKKKSKKSKHKGIKESESARHDEVSETIEAIPKQEGDTGSKKQYECCKQRPSKHKSKSSNLFIKPNSKETNSETNIIELNSDGRKDKRIKKIKEKKKCEDGGKCNEDRHIVKEFHKERQVKDGIDTNRKINKDNLVERKGRKTLTSSGYDKTNNYFYYDKADADLLNSKDSCDRSVKTVHHSEVSDNRTTPNTNLQQKNCNFRPKTAKSDVDFSDFTENCSKQNKDDMRIDISHTALIDDCNLKQKQDLNDLKSNNLKEEKEHFKKSIHVSKKRKSTESHIHDRREHVEEVKYIKTVDLGKIVQHTREMNPFSDDIQMRKQDEEMIQVNNNKSKVVEDKTKCSGDESRLKKTFYKSDLEKVLENKSSSKRQKSEKSADKLKERKVFCKDNPSKLDYESEDSIKERFKKDLENDEKSLLNKASNAKKYFDIENSSNEVSVPSKIEFSFSVKCKEKKLESGHYVKDTLDKQDILNNQNPSNIKSVKRKNEILQRRDDGSKKKK